MKDVFRQASFSQKRTKLLGLQTEIMKSFAPGLPLPVAKTIWMGYRDTVKNFPLNDFHLLGASASAGVR